MAWPVESVQICDCLHEFVPARGIQGHFEVESEGAPSFVFKGTTPFPEWSDKHLAVNVVVHLGMQMGCLLFHFNGCCILRFHRYFLQLIRLLEANIVAVTVFMATSIDGGLSELDVSILWHGDSPRDQVHVIKVQPRPRCASGRPSIAVASLLWKDSPHLRLPAALVPSRCSRPEYLRMNVREAKMQPDSRP